MTGQQLRNSILQLAIQGKLVAQDPKEEPASAMLKRIAEERAARPGKRKAPPSRIERRPDGTFELFPDGSEKDISDEIPFDIPESWEWARLSSVAQNALGKTLDKQKAQGNDHPYLCSINVYWEGITLDYVKEAKFLEEEIAKYSLRPGDLLVCEGGDVGRAAVWEEDIPMCYQNALHRVRFYCGISPYYVKFLIETYKSVGLIEKQSKGVTIKHLTQGILNNFLVPLPPLREQQRIVAKIESLLPLVERYGRKQDKLNQLNEAFPKRLRQSLLQAAIEGKLVAQDPKEEPASALLERIAKERAALPGKRKAAPPSRIERRSGGIFEIFPDGSEKDISDEIPFDIPERWEWVRLSSLGTIVGGGTPSTSDASLWDGDVPWITPADMKELKGKYVSHGSRYISPEGVQKSSTKELPAGSVVFSSRAPIGYVAIAKNTIYTNQGFKSVVFTHSGMSDYVYYSLIGLTDSIKQRASGTTFAEISGREFGKTLIPLPPLQEQHRIVQRLEELLPLVSQA